MKALCQHRNPTRKRPTKLVRTTRNPARSREEPAAKAFRIGSSGLPEAGLRNAETEMKEQYEQVLQGMDLSRFR